MSRPKRSRNLLILLVVLLLLGGCYLFLKYRPVKNTADDSNTTKTAAQSIVLAKLDTAKLNLIRIQSSRGSLSLRHKASGWVADSASGIKLEQYTIDSLASNISNLSALQEIETAPADLAQYGLDNPRVTVTARESDQKQIIIRVGDETPTGNAYYAMVQGDPKVYTISGYVGQSFDVTLDDLRDKSLPAINTQELEYLLIAPAGGRAIEIVPNKNAQNTQYGVLNPWSMTKPYPEPKNVGSDQLQKILDNLASLTTITSFISDRPGDPGRYGLAKPRLEIVAKDKQNTLHLYVGNDYNESEVYCKLDGSPTVFTLLKDSLEAFNVKPFDLIEKFACILNIDDVDRVEIRAQGKTHSILLTRKTVKPAKKGQPAEVAVTYRMDGKKIPEKVFKKFYQALIGLLMESESDRMPQDKNPEVTTTFYLNKGPQAERVVRADYVPYNPDFYAVFRNGKPLFLISRSQVRQMLTTMDQAIRGKLKVDD